MKEENMAVFPSLSGKVAFVTGAGSGIGRSTALLLAKNGINLYLIGRRKEKLAETAETARGYGDIACHIRSADVTVPEDIQAAVQDCMALYGQIDILCNVAGGSTGRKKLGGLSGENFDEIYRLNLKNVFLCCKEVLPHMQARCYGKIVNVSSLIGRVPGDNTNGAYAAMKGGIDQFTRYLAREVGDDGIWVNAVSPGYIEASPRISELWAKTQDMDKVFKRLSIKRPGTAMETANAIVFLCADESSYITGEVMAVDGGAPMA